MVCVCITSHIIISTSSYTLSSLIKSSKMAVKGLLNLRLLLVLSLVLSSLAVPATRSFKSTGKNPSSDQDLLTQDSMGMKSGEEVIDLEEGYYINGKIYLENTDYQGTGANTHHDPKAPGRP